MAARTPYRKLVEGNAPVGQRGVLLTLFLVTVILWAAPCVAAVYLVLVKFCEVDHTHALEVTRLSVDTMLWGLGLSVGGFTVKGGMEWIGRRGTINQPQPP